MQRLVEQLKLEAAVERIKVSRGQAEARGAATPAAGPESGAAPAFPSALVGATRPGKGGGEECEVCTAGCEPRPHGSDGASAVPCWKEP